ncbi:hypothetical protein ES703_99004 [subsurface metagenome]
MSIASVERKILAELREVVGDKKLGLKELTEWRTVKFEAPDGEKIVFLPVLGVWASYLVR